jgi:hypothetical protein
MFGYVNIYKPELKMKDYYKYKAYYCGLCKTLKDKYGRVGQLTLTYDMTFLIILLTSLYESVTTKEQHRCVVHPVKKHDILLNEITEYVADMNIALSYHHLLDDWMDEKSVAGLAGSGILKKAYKSICRKYPRQCSKIRESLKKLKECEDKKETNVDVVSRCFGELMAELFVYRKDIWEETLRKTGFYLGKFIYIMDAYDDLDKDRKKINYNPLLSIYEKSTYEDDCKNMLTMMMAECTHEFEKLPCVIDVDILRNILYNGVWKRYLTIQNEKNSKEGKKE